jgi:sugar phosphate isomerase/epimerase
MFRTSFRITLPGLAALMLLAAPAPAALEDAPGRLGWELATQCYTFRDRSFVETLAVANRLGLKAVEVYPGQTFSPEQDFLTGHSMDADQRALLKKTADEAGITLMGYGVVGGQTEADWRVIMEFAREMGMEFVNCEPAIEMVPMVDKLAGEYGLKIALHNHPKPSGYWDPATVVEAVAQATPGRTGACADTGHWVRSGLDPVASLELLDGNIGFFHFKDLKEAAPDSHDVIWGTGVNRVYTALATLKEQGFEGYFNVEYEHQTPELEENVAKSMTYFNLVSASLDPTGWQPLFDGDLSDAEMPGEPWEVEDGVLSPTGRGDLWSVAEYGDFVLDLEFKCAEDTNSGVFLRCSSIPDWLNTAIEVQILQQESENPRHNSGAIFDIKAPDTQRVLPAGEWNRYTIMALDNMLYVVLNGEQVLHIDLDEYPEPGMNPDGTKNKFNKAYKTLPRTGRVGLQYHGNPVWFRNIQIKSLD